MQIIVDELKRIEKYKRAMPILEEMVEQGNYSCYVGGSLIISKEALGLPDDADLQSFGIEPLNGTECETLARGQYLLSKIFVKHRQGSCFYQQALDNVKEYEEAHEKEYARFQKKENS